MRNVEKLLGWLAVIVFGWFLFILGIFFLIVVASLLSALFSPFMSASNEVLAQAVSLVYDGIFVACLFICIYIIAALSFYYRFVKRDWLQHHGLAVEATSQGVYYYEAKHGYILTLTWQFPHSRRMYTFQRTIHDKELKRVFRSAEGQFVVIFDPDAPSFYDVQLPGDPFSYPNLVVSTSPAKGSSMRAIATTHDRQEDTVDAENRKQFAPSTTTVDAVQRPPYQLSERSSAYATTSSFDDVHDSHGLRRYLRRLRWLLAFVVFVLTYPANVSKVWRIWRTRFKG